MVALGAIKVTRKRDGKRRQHPEQDFQASLVRTLTAVLDGRTFFYAVPNGGFRTRTEAAILIGQGVVPGVPDLIFIHDGKTFGLELKAERGRLSENQKLIHGRMEAVGATCGTARTLDEALAFLEANGIPLRIKGRG